MGKFITPLCRRLQWCIFGFVKLFIIQKFDVRFADKEANDIVYLLPFLELELQVLSQLQCLPFELVVALKALGKLNLIMLTVRSHGKSRVNVAQEGLKLLCFKVVDLFQVW
jgi:hypothetical protein